MSRRYLAIGTRVHFTHRACSIKRNVDTEFEGDDLFAARTMTPRSTGHVVKGDAAPPLVETLGGFKPPSRAFYKGVAELDRWVYVWPEEGDGFVTGLIFRSEGKWETDGAYGGYEYQDNPIIRYLSETARYPLYQIRPSLREKPLIVPVFACRPIWLVHHYPAEEKQCLSA